MIENFTLDTDANPQNMNKLIEGINKNEQDIEKLQTSVEGVSSEIGQKLDKAVVSTEVDLNKYITEGSFITAGAGVLNLPINWNPNVRNVIDVKGNEYYCTQIISPAPAAPSLPAQLAIRFGKNIATESPIWTTWREVSWKETPTETIITSGFASGWSGALRVSKTQEGTVSVSGVITKSSDLIVSVETVYTTLPLPTYTKNILVNLYNSGSASLGNSFCNLSVDIYGNLKVYPVAGTNLSGARQVYGFEIRYTTK